LNIPENLKGLKFR